MPGSAIEILPFRDELAAHFARINRQWISSMFVLEPIDQKVLEAPRKYIIETGGFIWFAVHPMHGVVGTCALLKHADGEYELTKMGVLESARGLKAGEMLLQHVLEEIPKLGAKEVFLLTNKKCRAAIHLYEKNGFVHDKEVMCKYGAAYSRCDVAMLYQGGKIGRQRG